MGCQNKNFNVLVQKNYKTIFANESEEAIRSELAKSCEISG